MKSNAQEQKEKEAAVKFRELVAEGYKKKEAAKLCGYNSLNGIKNVLERHKSFFEEQLEEQGFAPHNWQHGWLKTDGASIHIRNDNLPTEQELVDGFIKSIESYKGDYRPIERKVIEDGHCLVIGAIDAHINKLASSNETLETFNTSIAVQRVKTGIEDLIRKANGFNIDQIVLLVGHDILHTDNARSTTTKGTHVDSELTWFDSYLKAHELYVYLTEMLLSVADVHVIHNPSNHDFILGTALAQGIKGWFRSCPNITFDVDLHHRKYYQYGSSLIGSTHGDGAKEAQLPQIMATEAKEMWAATDHRYFYLGHIHHRMAKEYTGVTVEYMKSTSSADGWHSKHGMISKPASQAFIHSKDKGQVCRLTSYC